VVNVAAALAAPYAPQDIDDVTLAFPASVRHLMPPMAEIPDEFHMGSGNEWVEFQERWFFHGLGVDSKLYAKDGIDPETALRHLTAIQGSFEPKHQEKVAAVAYLASLWFDSWEPGA
jgi:hypothetical protein